MRFNLGDEVWRATFESVTEPITCPHCGGTGRLRVIFHDDIEASIECANCAKGYDRPTGVVITHARCAKAERGIVTGVKTQQDGTLEWSVSPHFVIEDAHLFATEIDALKDAKDIAAKMDADERAKIAAREKDTRSWAWNASYHRNEIKRAQDQITYHTAKMNVAALEAKKEKKG